MKNIIYIASVCIIITGCTTMDVENRMVKDINERNLQMETGQAVTVEIPQEHEIEKSTFSVDVEPEFITVKDPIVISPEEYARQQATGAEAVKNSMTAAAVSPQDFIGGTQLFDYDENKQFPIFTKALSMTIIQLEPGEEALNTPYLSDSVRWQLAGDIWTKNGIDTQLIMIKPVEVGLEANMLVITNKRLYNFILTSTKTTYMPMVKFRYPTDTKFVTSKTKREEVKEKTQTITMNNEYLSFNYVISKWILFAPEWCPIKAYDDGAKTYIVFPEMILQKEYPTVFEKNRNIVNYRVNKNVMIIDKLIDKLTIRLGKRTVTVTKKKGAPVDISKLERTPVEIYHETTPAPEVDNKEGAYKVIYRNFVPPLWTPTKVYDDGKSVFINFPQGSFKNGNPSVLGENNDLLMYDVKESVVTVSGTPKKIIVILNGETITIERKVEPTLIR